MKLEVTIPDTVWLGSFTRDHPELVLEGTHLVALPGGDFLGEFEIHGSSNDWTHEIGESPDVVEVENFEKGAESGRYRVRFHRSIAAALAAEHEIIVRFGSTSKNGILGFEMIARPSQMRRLIQALAKEGKDPRLVSIRRDSLRSVPLLLTPIQRTLFRQALAMGYFDVPRRITLTALAKEVSRSNSSVSETLAVVERKLAELARSVGA
jgi:predicted DNA binding protein